MKCFLIYWLFLLISVHVQCSFFDKFWGSKPKEQSTENQVDALATTETIVETTTTQENKNSGWSIKNWGDKLNSIKDALVDKAKEVTSSVTNGVQNVASMAKNTTIAVFKFGVDKYLKITEFNVNLGLKLLVNNLHFFLKLLKMEQIELPNIDTKPPYISSFIANRGYFKNLTSLKPDGDISIKRDGSSIVMDIPMKFEDMKAGYESYNVNIGWGVGTSGNISVDLKSNKISIRLRFTFGKRCALNVEGIQIGDFEGVDVKFTGVCKLCGKGISSATNYMANYMQNNIKTMLKEKLKESFDNVLQNNTYICSTFMGLSN